MEIATDTEVLKIIESKDHKQYGNAILSVLESFSATRFAPNLVGIVNDTKNIERRIRMIKKAHVFNNKHKLTGLMNIMCIFLMSGILLTSATAASKLGSESTPINEEALLEYDTRYLDKNVKVGDIITNLPYSEFCKGYSLQTEHKPYGITINYHYNAKITDHEQFDRTIGNYGDILFCSIKNLGKVTINFKSINASIKQTSTLANRKKYCVQELKYLYMDPKIFYNFLNNIALRVHSYPKKYSPAMSSIPGIKISAAYCNTDCTVRYSSQYGQFLTWDQSSGKIKEYGKSIELPYNTPVYWLPLKNEWAKYDKYKASVEVMILDKNKKEIAIKKVKI